MLEAFKNRTQMKVIAVLEDKALIHVKAGTLEIQIVY